MSQIARLNTRSESSHRPTRRRERQMQRFKSSEQIQRFLSAHSMIYGHFRPRRHLMSAVRYRRARTRPSGSGARRLAFRSRREASCATHIAASRIRPQIM
jgi:hypothetical protein